MSHTKEPWHVAPGGDYCDIVCQDHVDIARTDVEEDARRIVVCVNACAGISNADLEMDNSAFINVFNERSEWKARAEFSFRERDKLTKQRDELLAALEHFATWGRGQHRAQSKGCHSTFDMMMLKDEIDFAEHAIASAKVGA